MKKVWCEEGQEYKKNRQFFLEVLKLDKFELEEKTTKREFQKSSHIFCKTYSSLNLNMKNSFEKTILFAEK